jgi:hypothetical protein
MELLGVFIPSPQTILLYLHHNLTLFTKPHSHATRHHVQLHATLETKGRKHDIRIQYTKLTRNSSLVQTLKPRCTNNRHVR